MCVYITVFVSRISTALCMTPWLSSYAVALRQR